MDPTAVFVLRGAVIMVLALVLINIVTIVIRNIQLNALREQINVSEETVIEPKWVILLALSVLMVLGGLAWALVDGLDVRALPNLSSILRYCMYGLGNFGLLVILFVGGKAQRTRLNVYRKIRGTP